MGSDRGKQSRAAISQLIHTIIGECLLQKYEIIYGRSTKISIEIINT